MGEMSHDVRQAKDREMNMPELDEVAEAAKPVHRVRLYVDVEIPRAEHINEHEVVEAIRARIAEQVAGHRTPRRLAEKCEVSLWEE